MIRVRQGWCSLVRIGVEAVGKLQAVKALLHLRKHGCDASKGCINVEPARLSSLASACPRLQADHGCSVCARLSMCFLRHTHVQSSLGMYAEA
jgi:hypothetical protein